jgi:DNA-binding NarL/FixJ family response regulator
MMMSQAVANTTISTPGPVCKEAIGRIRPDAFDWTRLDTFSGVYTPAAESERLRAMGGGTCEARPVAPAMLQPCVSNHRADNVTVFEQDIARQVHQKVTSPSARQPETPQSPATFQIAANAVAKAALQPAHPPVLHPVRAEKSLAVVAEPETFYSAGLAAMLQQEMGFSEVLQVHDYSNLMDLLSRGYEAGFLTLDFDLPGNSGLATIRELREKYPTMRLVVFSQGMGPGGVLSIIAAGANGFIPKHFGNGAELLGALRTVWDDRIFVPTSVIEGESWRDAADGDDPDPAALAGLTERQLQVIKLLSDGHANKVIARLLGISPSTVKVHLHAAFRTLGVHSRLAALAALRPQRHSAIPA